VWPINVVEMLQEQYEDSVEDNQSMNEVKMVLRQEGKQGARRQPWTETRENDTIGRLKVAT
jgi:hypothetical protein